MPPERSPGEPGKLLGGLVGIGQHDDLGQGRWLTGNQQQTLAMGNASVTGGAVVWNYDELKRSG